MLTKSRGNIYHMHQSYSEVSTLAHYIANMIDGLVRFFRTVNRQQNIRRHRWLLLSI
jgi:hypothetical protein